MSSIGYKNVASIYILTISQQIKGGEFMFDIRKRVLKGRTTCGYDLYDLNRDSLDYYDTEKVYNFVKRGLIRDVIWKNGSIKGNGIDLRKVPCRQYTLRSHASKCFSSKISSDTSKYFDVRTGSGLAFDEVKGYKRRFAFKEVLTYLQSNTPKVCSIFGLRRTGKTVLMKQAVRYICERGISDKVAYVTINNLGNTRMEHILKLLNTFRKFNYKYIFIDEITNIVDFIDSSSILADSYALDLRLVITGTDSLGLRYASKESLYDRVVTINTTYIPYMEYKYLFNNTTLDDYLRQGGVLTKGVYDSRESINDYINTAIYQNICRSLQRYNHGSYFESLRRLFNRDELYSVLLKVLDTNTCDFTVDTLLNKHAGGDISSAFQLVSSKLKVDLTESRKMIIEEYMYYMGIKSWDNENDLFINNREMHLLEEQLYLMGFLKDVGTRDNKHTIMAHPGLRYFKACELCEILLDNKEFIDESREVHNKLLTTFKQDVLGRLLEDCILVDTLNALDNSKYHVMHISTSFGEVDMIVLDTSTNSCYLFEVKHSNKSVPKQFRWLIDTDLNSYIERNLSCKINERIVLYMGANKVIKSDTNVIRYINASDYLSGITSIFNRLQSN